jgi:biopolymer transport protein ExbD
MRARLFDRGSEERDVPALNTSSLPDLIFTVLFFFMIVTHMRDVDMKVRYEVPQGTEVQKLGHKSSIVNIYIGRKAGATTDGEFYIQLNNDIATVADISAFLDKEKARMSSEDLARMTVSIKADRDVPMSLIADVKRALQQEFALRLNYSATEKNENTMK